MQDLKAKPWEQRADESNAAYRAFLVYRDLGPKRTLDSTGFEITPKRAQKGRKRGSTGCLRAWAKRFHWAERARAWDDWLRSQYQRATERATAAAGEDWVKRQTQEFELKYLQSQVLVQKADLLARMPVLTQRVEKDEANGVTNTIIEAVDPKHLVYAARLAVIGHRMAQEAIDGALALVVAAGSPIGADAGTRDQAAAELEQWRRQQREKIVAFPGVTTEHADRTGT